jgi:lipoprotein-releasing system permease protein
VALATTVMIAAMSILIGFKQEITNKVTGFLAHIHITNYDGTAAFDAPPIVRRPYFLPQIEALPEVRHIQAYALKAGIIATENDMQGVVLKGVDKDFEWTFFDKMMAAGEHFVWSDTALSNGVCISQTLADMLRLRVDDRFDIYFVQDPPRVRRFRIAGIFNTQFGELDKLYVLCDIRHVQRLNNWNSEQVTGLEIFLKEFSMLTTTYQQIANETYYNTYYNIYYNPNEENARENVHENVHENVRYVVESVREQNAQIFDWLDLLDMNALIIFVLMLLVAGFNMVSGLLILILERTQHIGLLKALGCTDGGIRRIFVYQALFIAVLGLAIGNAVGIGMCLLQQHFGFITLDQETYYLSVAPVSINWAYILLLNAASLLAILLMLIVPSMFIAKINPSKALRFL